MIILYEGETIDHALARFKRESGEKIDAYMAHNRHMTRNEIRRAKALNARRRRARKS